MIVYFFIYFIHECFVGNIKSWAFDAKNMLLVADKGR